MGPTPIAPTPGVGFPLGRPCSAWPCLVALAPGSGAIPSRSTALQGLVVRGSGDHHAGYELLYLGVQGGAQPVRVLAHLADHGPHASDGLVCSRHDAIALRQSTSFVLVRSVLDLTKTLSPTKHVKFDPNLSQICLETVVVKIQAY